jgi:hypothetical protein
MKKYFLVINDNKCGPYSISDLQSIDFDKNTLVWHNGLINWTKAENIKELSTLLEETPPPLPTKIEKSAQSIKLESPIDVNIKKMKSYSKDESEEKSRNVVKGVLSETGILISILLVSILVAFSTYQLLLSVNKPDLVSKENQRLFNEEFSRRQSQNSVQTDFGDIMSNYLGFYKYDDKISSSSDLEDINEFRMRTLNWKSEEIAWYVFYILLGVVIFVRYLLIFIRWLNPKKPNNKLSVQEMENNSTDNKSTNYESEIEFNTEKQPSTSAVKYDFFDIPIFIEDEKKKGNFIYKDQEINYILELQEKEKELISDKIVCNYCKAIDSIENNTCLNCGRTIK